MQVSSTGQKKENISLRWASTVNLWSSKNNFCWLWFFSIRKIEGLSWWNHPKAFGCRKLGISYKRGMSIAMFGSIGDPTVHGLEHVQLKTRPSPAPLSVLPATGHGFLCAPVPHLWIELLCHQRKRGGSERWSRCGRGPLKIQSSE